MLKLSFFFQYLSKKFGLMGQKTSFAPVKYWPQVSDITGYKTAISEVKLERDSIFCERPCRRTVELFKNKVS